jgi:hypothetical protein
MFSMIHGGFLRATFGAPAEVCYCTAAPNSSESLYKRFDGTLESGMEKCFFEWVELITENQPGNVLIRFEHGDRGKPAITTKAVRGDTT